MFIFDIDFWRNFAKNYRVGVIGVGKFVSETHMKFIAKKTIAVGAGALMAASGIHAQPVVLYNNTTTDTGNSLSLNNNQILGDEIFLSSSSPFDDLTDFSFEIYSANSSFMGDVQMTVSLYANNGTAFNGYPTPGTVLYTSSFGLSSTPTQSVGANAEILDFDLSSSPVQVPSDLTLAVSVTGLEGSDSLGIELFDPPSVGQNYDAYWLNTGSTWALYTNSIGTTEFGAKFTGTPTPEPSSLYLGAMGLSLLMGTTWLRRRQVKQS